MYKYLLYVNHPAGVGDAEWLTDQVSCLCGANTLVMEMEYKQDKYIKHVGLWWVLRREKSGEEGKSVRTRWWLSK